MRRHTNRKTTEQRTAADVIILCGGQGTRLRPVLPDRPKALATLGAGTVIDLILARFASQGFSRVILAVGHRADMLRSHLARRAPAPFFSEEEMPLGTGGALKRAWPLARSPHIIVQNGDTLCPVNLRDLLAFHRAHGGLMTMVVSPATRQDGGSVALDATGRLISFSEKDRRPKRHINAGIYVFRADALHSLPSKDAFSLEHDFFPSLIAKTPCYGYVTAEEPMDIGTPERYERALRNFGGTGPA